MIFDWFCSVKKSTQKYNVKDTYQLTVIAVKISISSAHYVKNASSSRVSLKTEQPKQSMTYYTPFLINYEFHNSSENKATTNLPYVLYTVGVMVMFCMKIKDCQLWCFPFVSTWTDMISTSVELHSYVVSNRQTCAADWKYMVDNCLC